MRLRPALGSARLRCPRPKHRGVGRVVGLALAGGVAVQVLFAVAVVFAAGFISPPPTILRGAVLYHAGPGPATSSGLRTVLCVGKDPQPKSAEPGGRRRAQLARSVAGGFKPRFRTDMTGLRNSTRKSADSPKAISFEHAVRNECHVARGMNPRFRAKFLKAIAQFSRPGYAKGRSAGQGPESGQKRPRP
jgi:hypothetical protein